MSEFKIIRANLFIVVAFCLSARAFAFEFAPDFSLQSLAEDKTYTLSDFKGKVVYLDFWASFCGPCRQSLPALDALQKEYDREDFEVVAINLDADIQDARDFLTQYPVSYTILTERTGKTQRAYDLVGLPSSFLIGRDGEIIGAFQGFHPDHIIKLRKALGYLLEE